MKNKIIPIFYAVDDNFVKYMIVSMQSMLENCNQNYTYHFHILNTHISDVWKEKVMHLKKENVKISFDNVENYLVTISDKLPIRDYYSKTTYFRLFIAEMFPQYDKAIYLDSDTVVIGDISTLYNHDLKDNYVGACIDQAFNQVELYGDYAEKVLGINRHLVFNAGMMLINCKLFRENKILDRFINLLNTYNFIVTQDEDYLNILCKDHVLWLDNGYNTQIIGKIQVAKKDYKIIHYNMVFKPWHYKDCVFAEYFWKYAKKTEVYHDILNVLNTYSEEEKFSDDISNKELAEKCLSEINKEENYLNMLNRYTHSQDRMRILTKMEQLEKEGRFDEDVEEDPPSKTLLPDDINYLDKSIYKKAMTSFAFMVAKLFVNRLLKSQKMIVKEIKGIENFQNLKTGAIITCNHFNPYDSFAIQLAYEKSEQKKKFYRVIKEGNYTSFPGFYGFLMRNCNTLPLSSNYETMKNFVKSVNTLLQEGNFILVYPEQSLWWNYRKPKPLKNGAFNFASKNNVPVLPCFITMKDSQIMGDDGFFVQEYTIHIEKPIYPEKDKSVKENVEIMKDKNFAVWKDIYEQTYHIPLTYLTKK